MDFFKGIGDFFGGLFGKKKKQNEVDNWNPQPTRLNSQPNTLSSQTDLGSTKFNPSTNFETKPDYSFKTTALTPSAKPFDDTTDFSKDNTSGLNLSLNNRNKLNGNKFTLGGSSRIENTAVHEDDVNDTIKQLNDRYHDERNSFGRFWGGFTGDTDRRDKELRRKIITDEMKKITNGLGSNPDGTYKRDFNDDEAYKMATLQLALRHGIDGQPLKAFVPNVKMQSNEKVGNINLGDWGLATARTIKNMTDGEDGLGGLVGNALLGKRKADEGFNLGRFVADLPSGMISGMAETGADISDVLSGKRMLDDGSIQDLNGLQRFGSGLNAALNVGDLQIGGSGTLFRSIFKNGIKQAAKEAGEAGLKETAKRIAKDLAKDAAKEGLEEGIQQIAQNLSNTDNYNANGNFKAEKLLDQVGESAALGALGGGIMSGAGLGINSGKAKLGELSQNIRQNIDQKINPQTNPVQNAVAKIEANNSLKYSLSQNQENFFKDSKIRDENGDLKKMYHGSPTSLITEFRPRSYFTDNKNYAERYKSASGSSLTPSMYKMVDDPKIYEVYIDAKNPFTLKDKTAKKIYFDEYVKGGNSNSLNPYEDYTELKNSIREVDWTDGEDFMEWLQENHPEYDALYMDEGGDGGYDKEYVDRGVSLAPFNSNQIKYTDNVNPTNSPDIRYKNDITQDIQSFSEQNLRKIIGNEYDIISKASDNTPRTAQALLDNSLDRVINNFDSLSSDQQGKILEMIKNEKINNNSSNHEAKNTAIEPVIANQNNSPETNVELTETEHTETPRQNQPENKAKNDGNPTRKFIKTVLKNAPPKDFRQAVEESNGKGKYKVRNTESLWKQAVEEVAKDPLGSFKDIEDARSDKAIAKGIALAEYFKAQGDNTSSSAVYIKLAEKATEAGRRVQALSLIKKSTPEGMLMNISRQIDAYNNLQDKRGRFAKDKIILDDQTRTYWYQRLQEIYEMPAKTKEQERTKKIAMGQFNKEVSKIFPSKKWDKTMAIWKAGLLSAPTTHIRNIVGNTANLVGETFSNVASIPADLVASKFTGIRSTTLKGTKGYGRGLAEGWKTAKDIMHTGVDTSGDVIAKYDSKDVHFDSKLGKGIQAYTDTIFRALNAADKPFKQGMFESSIDSQAYAMAKNKGLKGKEAKAYAENLIKNPTAEMQEAATVDAEMATFQQSTAMGNAIRGAKNKGGNAGKALDVVTPFTQVPSAVADQAVNYSPLGLVKAVKQFGDVKKAINAGLSEAQIMQLQRKAVKQTGRFITGTALVGAGVILAKNGMLSGAAKDDKERRQWQAEGKMENAVKIGNNWFSLDSIAPELLILNAGGQLYKDLRNSNDVGATLAKSGLNIAKQFTEQSYMMGLKSGLDAITDPERSVGKLFGSLATSVIPNAVKKGAQSLDDKQRQVNSLEDSLKASVPGLRNTLPQKYDIYGKPMQNDMSFLENLFSPVRRTNIKENNLTNSVDALREKDSDYDKIIPDRPPKTVKIGNENHTLTAEESSEYQRLMGELTSKYMQEQGFNNESFKRLSDDDKVKILTNIKTDVKGAVENHLFNNKNPEKINDNKKVISYNLSGGQTADPVWQAKEEKKEDLYTRKEAEYEEFKKEYEEKSAKGEYSRKSRIEAQNKLRKLEVGKDFTKETRDLYGLGKDDFRNLIESSEDGSKVLDDVLAYGDALVKAGIISRNKFRDRSGNLSLSGTSTRGRSSGSRSGGGTPSYKMDTMSLIRGALKSSSSSKASVGFNRKAATKANTQAIKRLNSSKNKR